MHGVSTQQSTSLMSWFFFRVALARRMQRGSRTTTAYLRGCTPAPLARGEGEGREAGVHGVSISEALIRNDWMSWFFFRVAFARRTERGSRTTTAYLRGCTPAPPFLVEVKRHSPRRCSVTQRTKYNNHAPARARGPAQANTQSVLSTYFSPRATGIASWSQQSLPWRWKSARPARGATRISPPTSRWCGWKTVSPPRASLR